MKRFALLFVALISPIVFGRTRIRITATIAVVFALALISSGSTSTVLAHEHGAYNHDSEAVANHPNWMVGLDDDTPLSQLSLPGTHDTLALCRSGTTCDLFFTEVTQAQSMSLINQLNSGIRVLDIRIDYKVLKIGLPDCDAVEEEDGSGGNHDPASCFFPVYHGSMEQGFRLQNDALDVVVEFLDDHPEETVLMRISENSDPGNNPEFADALNSVLASPKYAPHLIPSTCATTAILGPESSANPCHARGRIGILKHWDEPNVPSTYFRMLPSSQDPNVQDEFKLASNWKLDDKWATVKAFFEEANNDQSNTFYFNYLSGAGGASPFFVASGHVTAGTSDARLATGATSPGWGNSRYPDFPRLNCWGVICTIAFEGTNVLAQKCLAGLKVEDHRGSIDRKVCEPLKPFTRVGIVMADFPGKTLIEAIANVNRRITLGGEPVPPEAKIAVAENDPPTIPIYEGSVFEINATGSSDINGDQLFFEWQSNLLTEGICERIGANGEAINAYVEAQAIWINDNLNHPNHEQGFAETDEGKRLQALVDDELQTDKTSYVCSDNAAGSVTVNVTDGVYNVSASANIIVVNSPPVISIQVDPMVDEGGTVTLTGSFTDPGINDTHTGSVDWGDGSTTTATIVQGAGSGSFTATRRYVDDGPPMGNNTPQDTYEITATIFDDDGGSDSATVSTIVKNVVPTITSISHDAAIANQVIEGEVVTISGSFADAGITDIHTVNVDWADGTAESITLAEGARDFSVHHRYQDNPTGGVGDYYPAFISVDDDDLGTTGLHAVQIYVANLPPAPVVTSTLEELILDESKIYFDFTDPGVNDDTWSWVVDWKDGTTTGGTGSPGPEISSGHVYELPGDYSVEVCVTDKDGGTGCDEALLTILGPSQLLERALESLGHHSGDRFFRTPLQFLERTLNPRYWADEVRLSKRYGNMVGTFSAVAVANLDNPLRRGSINGDAADWARAAIFDIVEANRILAEVEIGAAQDLTESDVFRINQLMLEAGQSQALGKWFDAIRRYRTAWKYATRM